MKNILVFIFCCCLFAKADAQYYDTSYVTATGGGYHGYGATGATTSNDRYGNVFQSIGTHNCQSCIDHYFIKRGSPQSWSNSSYSTNATIALKGYGDYAGNTYAFGTCTGGIRIGTTMIGLYTNTNHYALIKYDTIGVPLWAFVTVGNRITVTDSGYAYVAGRDSVAKYSPAGTLVWVRTGGGIQINATDNNTYYLTDSLGVSKYRDNGNQVWRVVTTRKFHRTYNNRLFLYDTAFIDELNPSTGQVIHTQPNQAGTINFFDKNGDYYETADSVLTKYNSTGITWTTRLTGTKFSSTGIDFYNNIYFGNIYTSFTEDAQGNFNPVKFCVPPDLYMNPEGFDAAMGSPPRYIYIGKINQRYPATPSITTGPVKAICKKGETTVPFTVDKYMVGFANGLRAELSDSTGNFGNPYTLGTGVASPIIAATPNFNWASGGYKIRVVAQDPLFEGDPDTITQITDDPRVGINLSNCYLGGPTYCSPLHLALQPTGPYTYQWAIHTYQATTGYTPLSITNDSLVLTSGVDNDYRVKITDTITGCHTFAYAYLGGINNSTVTPYFLLPDTVCLEDGPLPLRNNYLYGSFQGAGVYNDIFYPDSVGSGLHGITLHIDHPPSCYTTGDTTQYVFVQSCNKQIRDVHVTPQKNGYCAGDTLLVYFDYDSALFDTSNVFKIQLGQYYYDGHYYITTVLDSGKTSPITCIIPSRNYNDDPYRVRVVSSNPIVTDNINHDILLNIGNSTLHYPYQINGRPFNCGSEYSMLNVNASWRINLVKWHLGNNVFIDSIINFSSFLATTSGEYVAELITSEGCSSWTDTIRVIADSLPAVSISASSVQICTNDSALIQLSTNAVSTIDWYRNNSPFYPADPDSFYVTQPGNYAVKVFNTVGCFVNSNITIQGLNATAVMINNSGSTTSFCTGDSINLVATGSNGLPYLWYRDGIPLSPPVTASSLFVKDAGSYTIRYINQYGCTSFSLPKVITVFSRPSMTLAADSIRVCTGSSLVIPVTISGTPPFQLTVKKGSTTVYTNNNIATNATQVSLFIQQSNMYYFLVSQIGCSEQPSDSVYVTANIPPVVLATPQGLNYVCRGDSLLLHTTPASGYFYQWYKDNLPIGGAVSSQKYVKSSGAYKVVVTDSVCTVTSNTLTVVSLCDPHNNPGKAAGTVDESAAFDIYPNPAGTYLTLWLKHKNAQHGLVKIYNLLSQEVLVQPFYMALDEDELRLDVSMLGKGVYFFYLQTETNSSYTRKFIIE